MVEIKFFTKRSFSILIITLVFSLFFVNLINASVYSLCLTKGQTVKFSLCNPSISDRYCSKSLCQYCVSESNGIYCPLSLSNCYSSGDCVYLPNETVQDHPVTATLTNPLNNYSTNNNLLTFSYKVTNPSYVSNCSLYINNFFAASNSSKITTMTNSIQNTLPLNPGNYSWYIKCSTLKGNSSISEIRSLSIQSNFPINQSSTSSINITIVSPSNDSSFNLGVISFVYSISNITNIHQCNLVCNGSTLASANASSIINGQNNFSLNITGNVSYNWNINCIDKSFKNYQSENRILTISDSIASTTPTLTDGGSGGSGGGNSGGGGGGSGGTTCNNKWECNNWSECKNGVQARTCNYNVTKCKPQEAKPAEGRSCEIKIDNSTNSANVNATTIAKSPIENLITGASVALSNPRTLWGSVAVIVICIFIAYFLLKKNKEVDNVE